MGHRADVSKFDLFLSRAFPFSSLLLVLLQHLFHPPPADAVPGLQHADALFAKLGTLLLGLEDAKAGRPAAAGKGSEGCIAGLSAVGQGKDLVERRRWTMSLAFAGVRAGVRAGVGGGGRDEGGRGRGRRRAGGSGEGGRIAERVGEEGPSGKAGGRAGRHGLGIR